VAPKRHTLGFNGCSDCHSHGANFFKGQRVFDMYSASGEPITFGNGRSFGCNPVSFAINTFHQQIVSPYIGPVIIVVIFLIVVHYHSYGPKRITFDPYSAEIQRFSLFERFIHLLRLLAFVYLTVTGLIMAFNLNLWQELLFGTSRQLVNFHIVAGIIFTVTTIAGIFLWFKDAIFASYDRDWVRRIGGYLGYKGDVPAGRFNAGQKMFYWYTAIFGIIISITGCMLMFKEITSLAVVCITSTVHNLVGFVLISGVFAHAYLGTIANPGTWRVLVDGSVTKEWAKHHHPNWYYMITGEERPRHDNGESEEGDDSADGESKER
jgi:formate dehydrogenase subunit gamma